MSPMLSGRLIISRFWALSSIWQTITWGMILLPIWTFVLLAWTTTSDPTSVRLSMQSYARPRSYLPQRTSFVPAKHAWKRPIECSHGWIHPLIPVKTFMNLLGMYLELSGTVTLMNDSGRFPRLFNGTDDVGINALVLAKRRHNVIPTFKVWIGYNFLMRL